MGAPKIVSQAEDIGRKQFNRLLFRMGIKIETVHHRIRRKLST